MILEPSQSSRVGQKTNIIRGVPEPVRYRNGADKTARMEVIIATLFLNQRFRRRIKRKPRKKPKMMLGSLIA